MRRCLRTDPIQSPISYSQCKPISILHFWFSTKPTLVAAFPEMVKRLSTGGNSADSKLALLNLTIVTTRARFFNERLCRDSAALALQAQKSAPYALAEHIMVQKVSKQRRSCSRFFNPTFALVIWDSRLEFFLLRGAGFIWWNQGVMDTL